MNRFRKSSFVVAPFVILCFFLANCTPQQVDTAKVVFSKVSLYSNIARALIKVASDNYAADPKVKTALEATQKALLALNKVSDLVAAGLEKDEGKVTLALVSLMTAVWDLVTVIKEAKKEASLSIGDAGVVQRAAFISRQFLNKTTL